MSVGTYHVGTDAAGGAVFAGRVGLDAFVARHDDTGQLAWNHDLISTGDQRQLSPTALTVDDEIIFVGSLVGSVDFGGGILVVPPPSSRPVVVRYDLAGNHLASVAYNDILGRLTGIDRVQTESSPFSANYRGARPSVPPVTCRVKVWPLGLDARASKGAQHVL